MIRLGVIDSGVSEQWLTSSGVAIGEIRDFTGANTFDDQLGHGSAVMAGIGASNVELWLARVFDDRLTCPVTRIIDALEWLLACDVQLVNMSFGMTRADANFEAAVQALVSRGVVLIAASPAQGAVVYPAGFDGVIRATGDARCGPDQLSFLNSLQADFGGFPGIPGAGLAGSSIGCAHVTRIACEVLARELDADAEQQSPEMGKAQIDCGVVRAALRDRANWLGPERRGVS